MDQAKRFGAVALAAGAAVAAFAVKAIAAYAQQEKSVNDLKSALRAYGEEIDGNVEALKREAAAIQDETGVGDEATISRMARMKLLGVETGMLGQAAKAVIALAAAGMDEEMAMKAVVGATMGEFGALSRYLPALKAATSEAEKAAIVNEFLARGYQQSKDNLNTVGGAWTALKGRIGDVWEEVGAAIQQNGALQDVMARAGDAVKQFGERIREWVSGSGIARFIENTKHGFATLGNSIGLTWAFVSDGWATAVRYITNLLGAIKNNYVATFAYIKDMAVAVFNKIRHPMSDFQPPSIEPVKQALADYVAAIKGTDARVTTMRDAAFRVIEQEAQRHYDRLAEIEKQAARERLATDPNNWVPQAPIKPMDVAKEKVIDLQLADKMSAAEDAELGFWKEREQALRDNIAAQDDLARKTVEQFLDEQKAAKEAAKSGQRDADRAERIREKMAKRGMKVSKRDEEFLAAFDKIQAAKAAVNNWQRDLVAAQKAQTDLLAKINKNLVKVDASLTKATSFDGGIG